MTRRVFVVGPAGFVFSPGSPAPRKGRTMVEAIPAEAAWISEALQGAGYLADFTPGSISEVERFFVEQTRHGRPIPGSLLSERASLRLFGLGCYCGEVLRAELGGAWETDDYDPDGALNAALCVGRWTCWPMQRVLKRLRSSEDDLVFWAQVFREKVRESHPEA